jgi:hypothetical protein
VTRATLVVFAAVCFGNCTAQSLSWKPDKEHRDNTVIYGQVTVLLDEPGTYFCGADWWASHPAAGSTGIETEDRDHRKVMFSVWPTDKGDNAFPIVAEANPRLHYVLKTNDVHGSHCDATYMWPDARTYQFYVTKHLDQRSGAIVVSLFFYDEGKQMWIGEGRILSPIDGKKTIDTFDHITSSLHDLVPRSAVDSEKPRLGLFRLWTGTRPSDLVEVTKATGEGKWGVANNAFFLGMGDNLAVDREILRSIGLNGRVEPGKKKLLEVAREAVPENVVRALEQLG